MKNNLIQCKKGVDWKKWLFVACVTALPLLQFIIMYIVVNINSFVMAFRSYDNVTEKWSFVGFENFRQLFNDIARLPLMGHAFRNSIVAWLVSLVVGIPFALMFSYYIYSKGMGYKVFRVMLFLPSVLSATVLILIFKYFAETAVPSLYLSVFGGKIRGLFSNPDTRFASVLFFNTFIGFGTNVLMYTGSMAGISESCMEAAKLDGAGMFRTFFNVVLPQIVPTISVFVTTGIAAIFTNQLNLYSFYWNDAAHEIQTVGYFLYQRVQKAGDNFAPYPYAAALGICITVIVGPLVVLVRRLLNYIDPMEDRKCKR